MTDQELKQEISHIFDSGANEVRVFDLVKRILSSSWTKYDFKTSRPKSYGKYLVARKDGKVHKETWNGSGWAYNGEVIEYFMPVPKAPNQK